MTQEEQEQERELQKARYMAATFQQTKPDPPKEKSLGYQILIALFVGGGLILAYIFLQALGRADGSY